MSDDRQRHESDKHNAVLSNIVYSVFANILRLPVKDNHFSVLTGYYIIYFNLCSQTLTLHHGQLWNRVSANLKVCRADPKNSFQ